MIAYLSGTVRDIQSSHLTLVVNGIGFDVQVPQRQQFSVGAQVALEIYTNTSQDQGMQLFGFANRDERLIFTLIIGCSGVGPKLGLSVLSALTPDFFVSAILTNDLKTLSSIEGIGRKKAESLVMQLKDKMEKVKLSEASISQAASSLKQLSDVLTSLGYTRQETTSALEQVRQDQAPFDELLRKSLAHLAKRLS